jgi:SAM-dependent methyltransferase
MNRQPWEIWADKPQVEGTLVDRARGKLPEMESTKQLVKLIATVYRPGMRVLDAGCNTGHYLVGLRRLDPQLDYTGIDAYASYISQAKEIFAKDPHAQFHVKSILEPLFPEQPFDITFTCNVLLHLPNFKLPVRNLLASTRHVCFVRTLLGERSTIVRRAAESGLDFDANGNPVRYIHQNTYDRKVFGEYVHSLGWKAEFIPDEFDASVLAREHHDIKKGEGTRIVDGRQVDGNILFNWEWVKITR